jgi:hypothetical protein
LPEWLKFKNPVRRGAEEDWGEGATTMTFDQVRDHVIAFLTQLPDRVLLPVWEWIKDNAEATVALASLVVAFQAFRTSLETSKAQRKHNQLSVTPLVNIMFGDYDNDLFVKLVNNGTGPMVIKSITVIGAANPSEPLIDAMPDLPRDDLVSWRHFIGDATGRSIRAGGGEISLLHLCDNGEEALKDVFALSRDTVRAALGPLTLRVDYTDIYEKRFVTERSFDYFLRNKEGFVTERSLDILRNLPPRLPPPSDAR